MPFTYITCYRYTMAYFKYCPNCILIAIQILHVMIGLVVQKSPRRKESLDRLTLPDILSVLQAQSRCPDEVIVSASQQKDQCEL